MNGHASIGGSTVGGATWIVENDRTPALFA
jgi:hypothetical protein